MQIFNEGRPELLNKAEGRGQEAEGLSFTSVCDQREHTIFKRRQKFEGRGQKFFGSDGDLYPNRFMSRSETSQRVDVGELNLKGNKGKGGLNLLPSASCLLPSSLLATIEVPVEWKENPYFGKLVERLATKEGTLLAVLVGGFLLWQCYQQMMGGTRKKGQLARGYFGGKKEIATAKKRGLKQVKSPRCDSACLYIGRPQPSGEAVKMLKQTLKAGNSEDSRQTFERTRSLLSVRATTCDPKIFYIPDVQRGTLILGAPGSGKTENAILPMLYSAIDQDFPIIVYDFKYPSLATIAVFALYRGYDVHLFAPGFPESEVCNPLDFLTSETDAESARQIAEVIQKNFKRVTQASEDPFFGPAGDQLVEAVLMLAKSTDYPDVLMAGEILGSEQMVERLKQGSMNPWIRQSFSQICASAGSEKTVAGIAGSASLMFSRFMKQTVLAAFMGKTTLPLDLNGKQMIVFGLDREREAVCSPLLASVFHMIVARNIAKKRQDPLIVCIDEFPTLYLPHIAKWLNESRSEGFCGILGAQGLSQIERNYGKENSKTILVGANTKVLFNLGEYESARSFSDFLGDEEIKYKQKSRSQSQGKTTRTESEQEKTRRLMEPAQFNKLPPGACVFINPAYGNKEESYLPLQHRFKLGKDKENIKQFCEQNWTGVVKRFQQQSCQRTPSESDVESRRYYIDNRFPLALTDNGSPRVAAIGEYSGLFSSDK